MLLHLPLFRSALLAVTVSAAPPAPPPLDLHVQPGTFGQVESREIREVLQSAGGEIWRYCPGVQLDGIDVYYRSDHPQIDFRRHWNGRIAIGLSARDALWSQYGFQFAHEFCHTLANDTDNRRSPRYVVSRPANLWLEESLCETASLFTLRALGREWQTAPPRPAWKSYAPWFAAYVDQRLGLPEHRLPEGMPFPVWFRQNEAALRRNAGLRDSETIIASQCLPLFEAEPQGWKAVVYLNRVVADPNESLELHFAEWRFQCPRELRPFVVKLAAIFSVRI